MKNWELNSGMARLQDALDTLEAVWGDTASYWNDPTSQRFQETYLEALQADARIAMTAIQRIAEILSQADRACRDER